MILCDTDSKLLLDSFDEHVIACVCLYSY